MKRGDIIRLEYSYGNIKGVAPALHYDDAVHEAVSSVEDSAIEVVYVCEIKAVVRRCAKVE